MSYRLISPDSKEGYLKDQLESGVEVESLSELNFINFYGYATHLVDEDSKVLGTVIYIPAATYSEISSNED